MATLQDLWDDDWEPGAHPLSILESAIYHAMGEDDERVFVDLAEPGTDDHPVFQPEELAAAGLPMPDVYVVGVEVAKPADRGQGLAERAMQALVREADRYRINTCLHVCAYGHGENRLDNAALFAWYERLGFRRFSGLPEDNRMVRWHAASASRDRSPTSRRRLPLWRGCCVARPTWPAACRRRRPGDLRRWRSAD